MMDGGGVSGPAVRTRRLFARPVVDRFLTPQQPTPDSPRSAFRACPRRNGELALMSVCHQMSQLAQVTVPSLGVPSPASRGRIPNRPSRCKLAGCVRWPAVLLCVLRLLPLALSGASTRGPVRVMETFPVVLDVATKPHQAASPVV